MSKPTAFPLDESRLPFEIPRDEPYREKIARLGQMITDRIPAKKGILTKDDPEYWGLASIVTDEMADVALKMKVRKPMTLPELVKATGKPAGELEPLLQQMAVVGLLEYNWENPRREKQYILPMFVPGSAEFFNMNKQQIADHPEVTAFFERMTFLPLEHITAMVPPGGAGIGMHVIPVEKAIETENRSADIEHISHWLKKYDGTIQKAAKAQVAGDDATRRKLTEDMVLELYETLGIDRTAKADAAKREQVIDLVTGAITDVANDQLRGSRDGLYDDLADALDSGRVKEVQDELDRLMTAGKEAGSLKSKVTELVKPVYLAGNDHDRAGRDPG